MNPYQKAVVLSYAGGEFGHYAEDETDEQAREGCGDSLLAFLLAETDDDCDSWEMAIQRLITARNDIEHTLAGVREAKRIAEATPAKAPDMLATLKLMRRHAAFDDEGDLSRDDFDAMLASADAAIAAGKA